MIPVRTLLPALLLTAGAMISGDASAQCRSFAKNKCLPGLAPYTFNETFNAAQLAPGEEAEVDLTFFSGQDYRLMVCAHPILGEVNWKVIDQNGQVVFESLADEPKSHFDLQVQTTQQLTVQVWVPGDGSGSDMVHVGCVAVLVGFME